LLALFFLDGSEGEEVRKLDAGSIRKCWPMPQCVGRLSPCLLTLFRSFTEKRRPPFYLTVTNSVSEMIQ